jgi:hypothetical protein
MRMRNKLPLTWLIVGLSGLLSASVNALTFGNLTYDGTYITGDGYTYLGLDTTSVIGTTYADFVAATSAGGAFADFSIAGVSEADQFVDSLLSGANPCSSAGTATVTLCGNVPGWTSGDFGTNYTGTTGDWFQYEVGALSGATGVRPNAPQYTVGDVLQYEFAGWTPCNLCDKGIGYLVYREDVPEPSVLALLALGLFGLGFSLRRRPSYTLSQK